MSRQLRIVTVYFLVFLLSFSRCAYNDITVEFDCATSTLAIELVSSQGVSSCKAIDGAITVQASGGLAPYDFNINGGEYQTNSSFANLGPGEYTIKVKDKNNCWKSINVSISAAGSTLNASASVTADNQCQSDNGSAAITATGGSGPYQYQIDSKGFSSTSTFTNLKEGQHVVIVKDAEDCQRTLSVVVPHGNTGVSYAGQVRDILTQNCNLSGCHGAGTGTRDWSNFANLKANAGNVRIRTSNRTMPPDRTLTQTQIDLIACWVNDGANDN